MGGAVVLLRQHFLPFHHFAGKPNDHVMLIGLPIDRNTAECGAFDCHGLIPGSGLSSIPSAAARKPRSERAAPAVFAILAKDTSGDRQSRTRYRSAQPLPLRGQQTSTSIFFSGMFALTKYRRIDKYQRWAWNAWYSNPY